MKILKNSTYHNLIDRIRESDHEAQDLRDENQRLRDMMADLGGKLADARQKLQKFERSRGTGGRFVKRDD